VQGGSVCVRDDIGAFRGLGSGALTKDWVVHEGWARAVVSRWLKRREERAPRQRGQPLRAVTVWTEGNAPDPIVGRHAVSHEYPSGFGLAHKPRRPPSVHEEVWRDTAEHLYLAGNVWRSLNHYLG
jgi:hypothetical protein